MDPHLLKELKDAYSATQKELKFKTSFEEMESIVFLSDMVARDKVVSEHFSRTLCHRMIDLFRSWNEYFSALLVPNPANMFFVEQSQMLNDEEKREIILAMTRAAELETRNQLIGLSKDKTAEGRFVDESVLFWKKELSPLAQKTTKKLNRGWQERIKIKEEEAKNPKGKD